MIWRKKNAVLYNVSLVVSDNGTQKPSRTSLGTHKCNYRNVKSTNNNDNTTSQSGNPIYKELSLGVEIGLKRGDIAILSDSSGFDDGTYEVLDRNRHDKSTGQLANIIYQLKQIDG